MSEHDDPETRKSFEALRRSVEPTVDVDSSLAELHQRSRRPSLRPVLAASLGAVAVVAALVVGGVALLGGDDDQQVVSADQSEADATTTTAAEPDACRSDQVFVYMEPDAPPERIDAVAAVLERDEKVDQVEFMDRDATYAEFLELFAEQPDFVQAIRPEELPQSFRVMLTEVPTDTHVRAWESMPGVLRVEFPDQYECEVQRAGALDPAGQVPSDNTPRQDWGPLGVARGGPSGLEALIEGTLRITDECVTVAADERSVLLVWPSDGTTWRPATRTIEYNDGDQLIELSDGDRIAVGGGLAEGGTNSSDRIWVAQPDETCTSDAWFLVGGLPPGAGRPG